MLSSPSSYRFFSPHNKFLKQPADISFIYFLKNMSTFRLNCLVHGETNDRTFPVDIPTNKTIGDLKKMIKIEKSPDFDQLTADKLDLWKVNIPTHFPENPILKVLNDNPMADIESALKGVKTNPLSEIGDFWQEPAPKYNIHVIVKPPCKYHDWLIV